MLDKRTILGVIVIVIGIITYFFNPFQNGEEKVEVLVASKDINSGDKIEKDMIKTLKLSKYNLPKELIKADQNIIGTYAKTKLLKDDFIAQNKISVEPVSSSEYLTNLNGKQAISISLKTLSKGLSGKIETGDIVSIIVPQTDENISGYIPQELKYVEVIAVTDESGYDTNGQQTNEQKELYSTVTLLVNEEQAIMLASLEDISNIHISLVHRGDEEIKKEYLKEQDKVFGIFEAEEVSEENNEETSETNVANKKQDNIVTVEQTTKPNKE